MIQLRSITPRSWRSYLKTLRNNIYKIIYRGSEVKCPICESEFKVFAPYGGGPKSRPNALCPGCGSLERHRLLWLYLQENKAEWANKSLIHFAPEKVFYDFFAQEEIDYLPCDLFPEVYPFGELKEVDVTAIPFEDNSFGVILCNHVLEHVPDDRKALSELHRILEKGGWGILQVPLDIELDATYEDFSIITKKEREKAFGQDDHVRLYGKDYPDRLASAGFNVDQFDYVDKFSKEDIHFYGLDENETLYLVRK